MKKGGIGGANTNRGGLKFESFTDLVARLQRDLSNKYEVNEINVANSMIKSSSLVYEVVRKVDGKKVGIITKQFQF